MVEMKRERERERQAEKKLWMELERLKEVENRRGLMGLLL